MDFKVQLADNISDRQERIIKEALEEVSSYITDDITVNLAFTNSTTLGRQVKGVALPNRMGGLDEDRLNYSATSQSKFDESVRQADDNVITLDRFKEALARDSRTDIDRKFVASIDPNGKIQGSAIPASSDIKGVQLTTANAKAVGLSSANSSSTDGIISFNNSDNLSDDKFKILVMHEVGHSLGFVSSVDSVAMEIAHVTAQPHFNDFYLPTATALQFGQVETYRVNPLDLGRYVVKEYSDREDVTFSSLHPLRKEGSDTEFNKIYFSLDGGQTEVAEFALGSHYNDFETNTSNDKFYFQGSHWNDGEAQGIMNGGFNKATSFDTFSSVDLMAFDAIGYDVNYWGNSSGSVEIVDWDSPSIDMDDVLNLVRRSYGVRTISRRTSTRTVQSSSSTRTATRYHSLDTSEDASAAEFSYENYLNELTSQVHNIATDFRVEVSQFDDIWGFGTRNRSFATDGQILDLRGGGNHQKGIARFDVRQSGTYNLYLGGYDENDGKSNFKIEHNGKIVSHLVNDRQLGLNWARTETKVRDKVASNLVLEAGDTIKIIGQRNYSDLASIDYLDFEAVHDITGSDYIKLEAESFTRNGYRVESIGSASGGKVLSFAGGSTNESGSASYTFDSYGTYDVSMTAFDENDGQASIDLRLNGSSIGIFNLDRDLGHYGASSDNLRSQTVASGIDFAPGDVLTVVGYENASEHARLDYLEFTPSF